MLYIISMIIITILLVVAPIFFAMILFKITKELFDGWLKQLLSNAILIITLAGAIALIVNLLLDQLFKILLFGVCWDIIYSFGISGYSIFDIYFWKVTDDAQVDNCLNVLSIFTFIIICILLDAFMQEIPQLVDSLSGAFLQPISHFNDGAMRALENNAIYDKAMTFAGAIRSYASPGGLISHHKMGRGLIAKGRELYDKGERKVFGNLQGSYSTPDTQIFKGARDKVGSVIDKAEKIADSNLITKGIKGVFEEKDR